VTEYSLELALLYPVPRGPGRVALELQAMLPVSRRGVLAGDAGAEICTDPDERHLFVGVRGSNRIRTLELGADGSATPLQEANCGPSWRRHRRVEGRRLVVALERSSAIACFDLTESGRLSETARILSIGSPTRVLPHCRETRARPAARRDQSRVCTVPAASTLMTPARE
jgi:hypothetical protein